MTHNNQLNNSQILFAIILIVPQISFVSSLLCYSCVSTQPGCTMDKVDWLIHSAVSCPQVEDKCVKIIEKRGAESRVTRDCLSTVVPYRDDIPADHFEGCRPAARNPKKAVYVENYIMELEVKNNRYDNVTYCFCNFDHWCNGGTSVRTFSTTTLGQHLFTLLNLGVLLIAMNGLF